MSFFQVLKLYSKKLHIAYLNHYKEAKLHHIIPDFGLAFGQNKSRVEVVPVGITPRKLAAL